MSTRSTHDRCTTKACRGCYGEIAEIVAETQGLYTLQTRGQGGAALLNMIWRTMGDLAADMVIRTRSCIVTDFFHVSVKVQKVEFYDGVRTFMKPQLVLLPDFTSKFHLRNVLEMRDAHYHSTSPSIMGHTTVAAIVGVDRYVVEAAVKDSIREIGKYLQRNREAVLTIDVGVANLEFRGREYRIKWREDFLAALQESVGPATTVTPYDPPSMTQSGPAGACRFDNGCITKSGLKDRLDETLEAESRISVAEMNDGMGGSGYRKTYW